MDSETKTALAVTLSIIVLLIYTEKVFTFGVRYGAQEMLKVCQSGNPNCMPKPAPHKALLERH